MYRSVEPILLAAALLLSGCAARRSAVAPETPTSVVCSLVLPGRPTACATASAVRPCASFPMKKWRPRPTGASCPCLRSVFKGIHIKRKSKQAVLLKNSLLFLGR